MRAAQSFEAQQTNRIAPATVAHTVMAEQVSHNVVNQSESASASAPADAIANQTTTEPAGDGNITTIEASKPLTEADNETANAKGSFETAAEPSAGDAAVSKPLDEHARLSNGVSHDLLDSDGSVGVSSDAEGKKDMHHNRANSVKKPTTFSKVSVTKTFMAKTASPAPTAAKLGDKPSPLSATMQPANAAKPRLVAKTGALQSIQKARTGSESATGPDASKVWNKNRPAPPQPPKQFTDEELKQQYGIHLATRLQSDENGKEGKWADIDDDEEDWAPETVVWMDGTKSSLTPADVAPPPEQKPRQPEKPAEIVRPTLALKKAPEPTGPPRTILKPGIAAQQARQQNGSAAGTPPGEKPSLKTKRPAPAPTKSPWAALPPVAAVSPINPPVQQPPPPQVHTRMPTQDARAYEDAAPSLPAREIAADTFDRSWREGEGAPRELFNSASGRYEPAPEGRRSFAKADSYARKPSVLQRSQGAAEPSAAFQARSGSQLDGPYSTRRGSSVSQGSLPPARRMSTISKPDLPPVDDSIRAQHAVAQDARHEAHARPSFAQQSAWDQQMPPKPQTSSSVASPEPAEDLVKKQERVMKEKREEAKRRRKEEEERLEKEKQERLKARLAALEGAGKSRKERKAEAAATQQQTQTPAVEKQEVGQERPGIPAQPAEASATVGPALEAQSLPSAPEKKLPSPLPQKPSQVASLPGLGERPLSLEEQAQRQARDHAEHLSPKAAQRVPFTQQSYKATQSTYSSPGDRKQQLYRSPLTNTDAFQGWASSGANTNPWSMPGLGNGIFEKGNGFGPMSMGQQASLPPPPGVGRPSSTRISPQGFGQGSASPSLQEQPNAEQQGSFAPPSIDMRTESGWAGPRPNGVSPAPGFGRPSHPPGPIAPPSRAQPQQQAPVQRPDPLSKWNNAAARLPQQYAAASVAAEQKAQQEVSAPRDDSTIKDTFRQTAPNQKLGAPRRYAKTEYHVHDPQGSRVVAVHSPAPPSTQTQPIGPVPTASPLNAPGREPHEPENTVRIPDGSLNPAHGGLPNQQPPIAPPHRRHAAQATAYQNNVRFTTEPLPGIPVAAANQMTSPPPETERHPVFDLTSTRPNVRLPPPPPRVKLPPGPTSIIAPPHMQGMQPTVMMPQRPFQVWGPSVKPIAQTEDWQARFNGLFGRTQVHTEVPPSPPRTPPKVAPTPALAVAVSSRTVDDEAPSSSATVSLPRTLVSKDKSLFGFTVDSSSAATSKPVIDGIFTAELSFGSLPKVRVPKNVMYDVDVYPGHEGQHNLMRMGSNSKLPKAVDSQSKLAVDRHNLLVLFNKHSQGFIVRIPGADRHQLVYYNRQAGKGSRGGDRKPSGKFSKESNKGGKQPLERAKARSVSAKTS